MRFRRSGLNWEGRPWIVSGPVDVLAGQVESAWPAPHGADGTVASRAHDAANPRSDHRPTPHQGAGIVRAIDVGETVEDQGAELAEELRRSRDPRILYVIHEGRIFSSYPHRHGSPFTWRPFSAGHVDHVHGSFLTSETQPFNITLTPAAPPPLDWTIGVVMAMPTLRKGDGFTSTGRAHLRDDVRRSQGLLLANGFKDQNTSSPEDATDGLFGTGTEIAARSFQAAGRLTADGVIGRKTWTALLGQ